MMYNTYKIGIDMLLVVDANDVETTIKEVEAAGEKAFVAGVCEDGEKGVTLC